MRHIRLYVFTLAVLVAVSLSSAAFADNMTFISPAGNTAGGEPTYPYNFSINGGPTVSLLCDAFNNNIYLGETWIANETSIPTGTGLFGSTSSANYAAAGLIFDAVLNINGGPLNGTVLNTSDASWAIWSIFSLNALGDITPGNGGSPFGVSGNVNALNLYNAALSAAAGAPASDFAGIVIYTPVAGSQTGNLGTPQEFLGYTAVPEPSQVTFLGVIALLGIAGFAFRKRLAPALAIDFRQ